MKSNQALFVLAAAAGVGALGIYALRRRSAAKQLASAGDAAASSAPLRPERPCQIRSRLSSATPWRRDSLDLSGKVVLIAGGSRGLGLALAEEYGRHRAKLALAARDQNRLERARTKLLGLGIPPDDVSVFSADLRDSLEAEKLVAAVTRQFGQIDVLVNCAGTITVGPVENQPLHAFEEAIESNYYTMLHSTLAVLPQMLVRQAGSIVNIVSIGGKVAVPHLLPYSASKFAALGFSQGLHAEMRSKGVHVTTVCPGLMRTGSHTQAYFTGDREREYRWFSLAASMPGLSTSARHAAMRIVSATINRIPEITITPQAYLLARLGQAVPELIAAVMHWTNSLILPQPTDGQSHSSLVAGKEVRGKELKPLTFFGQHAARRYNQQA